ncbi:unnamed protein product [Protopolystoma xenopodis]|uniref:Uncharacterized protein n=1 Tax=Protopolystoma xenopodis TaxID=117903 RepID=A0A448XNQ9_9PLAT|nr:unnamed protein product [Protopolystoma xenopodis]
MTIYAIFFKSELTPLTPLSFPTLCITIFISIRIHYQLFIPFYLPYFIIRIASISISNRIIYTFTPLYRISIITSVTSITAEHFASVINPFPVLVVQPTGARTIRATGNIPFSGTGANSATATVGAGTPLHTLEFGPSDQPRLIECLELCCFTASSPVDDKGTTSLNNKQAGMLPKLTTSVDPDSIPASARILDLQVSQDPGSGPKIIDALDSSQPQSGTIVRLVISPSYTFLLAVTSSGRVYLVSLLTLHQQNQTPQPPGLIEGSGSAASSRAISTAGQQEDCGAQVKAAIMLQTSCDAYVGLAQLGPVDTNTCIVRTNSVFPKILMNIIFQFLS